MLEVRDLSVYYGDAQALDRVSLKVDAGQIVALIGANGAGKTSLIRTVAGILKPRAGSILFDGKEIAGLDSHRVCNLGVGQVAEGRQVFPSMSVLDNLQVGALLPRARASAATTLDHVFEMFPRLKERAGQLAGTLSGGEQQMLAIARVLRTGARVILLDEPTEGLAPVIVQRIGDVLVELKKRGMTILLVEQNFRFARKVADRFYLMEDGRMVNSFPGHELDARMDELHEVLGV
ncbi:MAG: ABC transporter ATP-binding protein [Gammaproteobacteria bacterium]